MHDTSSTDDRLDPAFWTVERAAQFLGISRGSAYKLANEYLATNGRVGVPVIRLGRRLMVPRAVLVRLAEGVEQ